VRAQGKRPEGKRKMREAPRDWNPVGPEPPDRDYRSPQAKRLATVQIGRGEPIDHTSLWRGERLKAGRGVKPLQGERPARTGANEPLETCSVLALDADGAVDGEARRSAATCAYPPRWQRPGGHAGRTIAGREAAPRGSGLPHPGPRRGWPRGSGRLAPSRLRTHRRERTHDRDRAG